MLVKANSANVFVLKDNILKTAPLTDSPFEGFSEKNLIKWVKVGLRNKGKSINPFELQKSDEI